MGFVLEPPVPPDEIVLELMALLQPSAAGDALILSQPLKPLLRRAAELDDLQRVRRIIEGLAALACYLATQKGSRAAGEAVLEAARSLAPKLAPLLRGAAAESAVAIHAGAAPLLAPSSGSSLRPQVPKGVSLRNRRR